MISEPKVTPSILGVIPDCLRQMLEGVFDSMKEDSTILISSKHLANWFLLERWGIGSSQRLRFKDLYSLVKKHCREVFTFYLTRGHIIWQSDSTKYYFGIYRYDDIRGNLILGFVRIPSNAEWKLPYG